MTSRPWGKHWVQVFVLLCCFKHIVRIAVKILKTPQPSKYSVKPALDVKKYKTYKRNIQK